MVTLHKKLSEIRDLRAEELDLVGGGYEGSRSDPTFQTISYQTSSMVQSSTGGYVQSVDDGHTETTQYDWAH